MFEEQLDLGVHPPLYTKAEQVPPYPLEFVLWKVKDKVLGSEVDQHA